MVLPKAGTMQPVKKILGVILGIFGLMGLFNVTYKIPLLSNPICYSLILVFAGYLLYIAGRQKR